MNLAARHGGIALLPAMATVFALAACSSHGSTDDGPAPRGTIAAPQASATNRAGSPARTPASPAALPTKVVNDASARRYVIQTSCAAAPGGWAARGTAKNPTGHPRTYRITVYFTTSAATVLNFATTTVSVAPGRTEHWLARKHFAAPTSMLCPMPGIAIENT